jgi:hypothetical protein
MVIIELPNYNVAAAYYNYGLELSKIVKSLLYVPYFINETESFNIDQKYWSEVYKKTFVIKSRNKKTLKIMYEDNSVSSVNIKKLNMYNTIRLKPFEVFECVDITQNDNIISLISSKVINNSNISLTRAEIKALCICGLLEKKYSDQIYDSYFRGNKYNNNNDYVYYFIMSHNNVAKLYRDTIKSPIFETKRPTK